MTPGNGVRIERSPQRADIQGLRAILMIQVLLYHAWNIGSPIGVDSFIMISAFLMTSSFVRRSMAGRMPFFVERWANTFKRLLPPLVIVVLLTLLGCFFFLGPQRWQEMVTQSFASVTYWENWRLIQVSADYYTFDHASASPFQHLWSMSMQGQMFIIWPVLMTLAVLLARRLNVSAANLTAIAFGVLAVASLAWLLLFAPEGADRYFNTASRIWEFAFGSMIAAWAAGRLRQRHADAPSRRIRELRFVGGWAALGVLAVYCLVSIGTYPGPMALVPLICVSVLLLAKPTEAQGFTAGRALSWRPLVWLGGISYAVYLVHWPIFVFYLAYVQRERLNVVEGIALIAASVLLAWVLTMLVDRPLQRLTWRRGATLKNSAIVALSLAVALTTIGVTHLELTRQAAEQHRIAQEAVQREAELRAEQEAAQKAAQQEAQQATLADPADATPTATPEPTPEPIEFGQYPGALALLHIDQWTPPAEAPEAPIPGPLALDYSWGLLPNSCPEPWYDRFVMTDNEGCTQQNYPQPTGRVLVAGSSHVQQNIIPPLKLLLDKYQLDATLVVGAACPWGDPSAYTDRCAERNQYLIDFVGEYQPDAVFLMATVSDYGSAEEWAVPGIESLVRDLTSRGIPVFGYRDNPRNYGNLYDCGEWLPDQPYSGCELIRSERIPTENAGAFLNDIEGFHMLDLTDGMCTESVCPTIIGNMHVYIDNSHLSYEYSASLAPMFNELVEPFLVAAD